MAIFGLGSRKSTVGLDIGSGLIKLVVIDHSRGEPELTHVATTPVLADAIVEGEIMDPGVVSDAIRGLFATAGVKQKSVVDLHQRPRVESHYFQQEQRQRVSLLLRNGRVR